MVILLLANQDLMLMIFSIDIIHLTRTQNIKASLIVSVKGTRLLIVLRIS